jgi:hypothetical protein
MQKSGLRDRLICGDFGFSTESDLMISIASVNSLTTIILRGMSALMIESPLIVTQTIEQAALDYLKRHWSVIPVRARDKRPTTRWLEFQHRHPGRSEVQDWFRRWPASNVGIVTGAISGLVVLDIDARHGGVESLDALIQEHGRLPHTIEAVTGGGGRHIYFAHPGGEVGNKVGLAPGIDLRADGGYVVAPPSVHVSGKAYAWVEGHAPEQTGLAPIPGWLLNEASSGGERRGHTLEHWRNLVKQGIPEGERNDSIASLTGHLLWHGVDADVAQELLLCWNRVRCRPPLSDDEVVRTVESIVSLHERDSE